MVDSRVKGRNGENDVKKLLVRHTRLDWQRVPLSGALPFMKGDLFVPNEKMKYCVEVKSYKDSAISHLLIHGKPVLYKWWEQTTSQSKNGMLPLLFFKHNRSPIYVMIEGMPNTVQDFIFINSKEASIMLAKDWLELDQPEFVL